MKYVALFDTYVNICATGSGMLLAVAGKASSMIRKYRSACDSSEKTMLASAHWRDALTNPTYSLIAYCRNLCCIQQMTS